MKTKLLFTALLMCCTMAFGQGKSNLIVFSETGDAFYLYINGAMQNGLPETNVKVNGVDEGNYNIKVVFDNVGIKNISKNAMVEPNQQYTLKVTTNRKGEHVLRFFGAVAINEGTSSGATEYDYSKVSVEKQTATTASSTSTSASPTDGGSTTVTTSTTVTETTNDSGSESVSMDVNMGGVSMGVNVNVNDSGNGSVNSSTTTSSSTVTTSSSTTASGSTDYVSDTETSSQVSSSSTGCIYPNADMNSVNKALDAEDFEDDKLALAKRVVAKKCLSSENIKSICLKFDFEDNRLDFAKYAYSHAYDPENYYIINEVFDFSDSKEELNNYIESK